MSNNLHKKFVPKSLAQLKERSVYFLLPDFRAIRSYLERYWFRALVLCFLAFLMLKKDISMQLSLKNGFAPYTFNAASAANSPDEQTKIASLTNTVGVLDAKQTKQKQYVTRFAKVAQAEMQKYGIPASITLAQGLLESNAGISRLAAHNNNHFGIKCFSRKCKKGHCTNFSDDSHKDFFRKYETAWESYRAHSILLQKERYQSLYQLDKSDYQAWAKGLLEAGYATDKQYAKKLINLIEELDLDAYDVL